MKLDGKYRLIHCAQGLLCSAAFGYNAFYLGEFGFDAGETGTLIAAFGVLTAVCLPIFGRIADKSRFFNWKVMLLIFAAVGVLDWGVLLFCDSKPIAGILFQTAGLLVSGILPMENVACFYYEKRGIQVNYGIARGLNSLAYAIGAYVLGQLTVHMGATAIAWQGLLVNALILPVIFSMPYLGNADAVKQDGWDNLDDAEKQMNRNETDKTPFWKKYPAFMVMILGSVLLMTVFSLSTTFLIRLVEEVGGNSGHLGTALAIMALTEVPILMLFSQIVKRIPVTVLLVISGIAYVLKCFVLFCSGSVWMIYAAQLLQPFSYGLYTSASVYFSDCCMAEEDAVTGQTLVAMSGSMGSVIGSLVGGWIVEAVGVRMVLCAGMAGALGAAAVFGIAMRMYQRERREVQQKNTI